MINWGTLLEQMQVETVGLSTIVYGEPLSQTAEIRLTLRTEPAWVYKRYEGGLLVATWHSLVRVLRKVDDADEVEVAVDQGDGTVVAEAVRAVHDTAAAKMAELAAFGGERLWPAAYNQSGNAEHHTTSAWLRGDAARAILQGASRVPETARVAERLGRHVEAARQGPLAFGGQLLREAAARQGLQAFGGQSLREAAARQNRMGQGPLTFGEQVHREAEPRPPMTLDEFNHQFMVEPRPPVRELSEKAEAEYEEGLSDHQKELRMELRRWAAEVSRRWGKNGAASATSTPDGRMVLRIIKQWPRIGRVPFTPSELPDHLTIRMARPWTLSLAQLFPRLKELPRDLGVEGSLCLCGSDVPPPPEDLAVSGSLHLGSYTRLPCRDNLGEYRRTIYAVKLGGRSFIRAGCFTGSLDEFEEAVTRKYGTTSAGEAYKAAGREIIAELEALYSQESEQ